MTFKINSEIVGALAAFLYGGDGPSHSALERVFVQSGYVGADPGQANANKQQRVLTTGREAIKRPTNSRQFMELMLDEIRQTGSFRPSVGAGEVTREQRVDHLRAALIHMGWGLSNDGRLESPNDVDLETGGREVLHEQLERLRRNLEDPAALIGGTKELLESISKFVLQENDRLPSGKLDFPAYFAQATELLRMRPADVDASTEGGKQVREIYQSAQRIAVKLNELRNLQGTGHGRTLPTGVTVETARFVVRIGTHVAELMLSTHDRTMGR